MKQLFLLFFLVTTFLVIGQSKKEKIQILSKQLDSLTIVQSIENQKFENQRKDLEYWISKNEQDLSQNSAILIENTDAVTKQRDEKVKLHQELNQLNEDLKMLNDSIQVLLQKQPIIFSERYFSNLTVEEALTVFNVSFDYQVDFPIASIEIKGRQDYSIGIDSFICIVFEVFNQNELHIASGTNFIGLLKYSNNSHVSAVKPVQAFATHGFGAGGEIEGFQKIGNRSLAVILNGGYGGMGVSSEDRFVYMVNKSFIMSVLQTEKHYDDQANQESPSLFQDIEKDVDLNIINSNLDYFDIEVIEKNHGKTSKKQMYKFNLKTMKYE